jgi:hypothetical protein
VSNVIEHTQHQLLVCWRHACEHFHEVQAGRDLR